MSDADEAGDSDVVADTYGVGGGADGVSAGQSRFSAGRGGKRQKLDDAPTSASTLSQEQARVVDLVMAGKNVRPRARLAARSAARKRLTGPTP
jgi:hypothetical protein